MFQVGDYVVYKKDVCMIKGKQEKYSPGTMYYVLNPIDDASLKIDIPVENSSKLLKEVMSQDAANSLIDRINEIEPIISEERFIESEYKELLRSGEKEDVVKVIKTTYLRNQQRKLEGKKIAEKDNDYFKKAEKLLYNELSVALDMDYDSTKEHVIQRLEDLEGVAK